MGLHFSGDVTVVVKSLIVFGIFLSEFLLPLNMEDLAAKL